LKTIAVFTTSRAEFGLYLPLLKEIKSRSNLDYDLYAGGTHLLDEYGNTLEEIKQSGVEITGTFDFLVDEDSPSGKLLSSVRELEQLDSILKKNNFDFVCVLGDRFELIPVVYSCLLYNKPLIHIHGGEVTEGATDEQFRHMITRASHLHFAACGKYANNIRKMGEENWRVFNTGALGVDAIKNQEIISQPELFDLLSLDPDLPTTVLTYHPVTLEQSLSPTQQMANLFEALAEFDLQVVITAPNVDVGREEIMDKIKKEVKNQKNYYFVESLGFEKYHSLVAGSEFVIGNSSSGLLEVPYFHTPTVNVGDRQKGRIRHKSVIDTGYKTAEIKRGIENALKPDFQEKIKNMELKFGDGHAAEKMVDIIGEIEINPKLLQKKLDFSGGTAGK
jgi:UDP-hydrolysing UDP-N-acetyl-D-glucosamine 2-epimerase